MAFYPNPFINQFPYMDIHEMNLDWIIKTCKQIIERMNTFEATNTVEFKGPWNITTQYPKWSIVIDMTTGYFMISKQPVPAGIDINNQDYWMIASPFKIDTEFDPDSYNAIANKTVTAKFSLIDASIAELIQKDSEIDESISDIYSRIEENEEELNSEIIDRTNADITLQNNITAVSNDLTNEITTRSAADQVLSSRIDSIVALPEGSTQGDAELMDIRVGYNGYIYQSAGDSVRTQVTDLHSDLSKVGNFDYGKNMINPDLLVEGAVQADGTITTTGAWAAYVTTDFIKLEANTSYAFSAYNIDGDIPYVNRRGYLLYDRYMNVIENSYVLNAPVPTIIANTTAVYIRLFWQNIAYAQLEKGSSVTSYVPYNVKVTLVDTLALTSKMKSEIRFNVIDALFNSDDEMELIVADDQISVTSGSFKRTYQKHSISQNKTFNFAYAFIGESTIKRCTDDITPLRIGTSGTASQWTVGANHGWPVLKIQGTSLTTADAGSIWSDGTTSYTLLKVDSGTAFFGYPASVDGNKTRILMTAPVQDLSHVSGATHTTDIDITGAVRDQLYPSINNNVVNVYADNNKEITENGTTSCFKITVKETYNILDYVSIQSYMQENIGASLDEAADNIDAILRVDNIYEITKFNENVYTTYTALKDCYLTNCGMLQADCINAVGGTVYRYANGVNESSEFDSTDLVNMSSYNQSINITKEDLINSSIPVNRCVDICKDNDTNEILYGFTFGFVPDLGDGANDKRKDLPIQWNMRETKKSYPYCIVDTAFNTGDFISAAGYRRYIMPGAVITNDTPVKIGDKKYFIIDAHNSFSTKISDTDYGNELDALENNGVKYADLIGAAGVNIASGQTYSAAILKTK